MLYLRRLKSASCAREMVKETRRLSATNGVIGALSSFRSIELSSQTRDRVGPAGNCSKSLLSALTSGRVMNDLSEIKLVIIGLGYVALPLRS